MRKGRFPPFGFVSSGFGLRAFVLLWSLGVFAFMDGGMARNLTTAWGARRSQARVNATGGNRAPNRSRVRVRFRFAFAGSRVRLRVQDHPSPGMHGSHPC